MSERMRLMEELRGDLAKLRATFEKAFVAVEMPNGIDELESMIENEEKTFGAKRFLRLATDDAKIDPLLKESQTKLKELLSTGEVEGLKPYETFIAALEEKDPTERAMFTVELMKNFHRALVGAAMFSDKLHFIEEDQPPTPTPDPRYRSQHTEIPDPDPQPPNNKHVPPPPLHPFVSRLRDDDALLPPDYPFGRFNNIISSKSANKFSINSFKSYMRDLSKDVQEAVTAILHTIYEYECVTPEMVECVSKHNSAIVRTASMNLCGKGYIRECMFDELGTFYCATAKGAAIFDSKDFTSMLGIKRKKVCLIDGSVEYNAASMAVRLAFAKAAAKIAVANRAGDEEEKPNKIKQKKNMAEKISPSIKTTFMREAFVVAEPDEHERWQVVTGGFWTSTDEGDKYFEKLKECLRTRTVDNIVIVGADRDHGNKVIGALNETWGSTFVDEFKVSLYSLKDDAFYIRNSDQPLNEVNYFNPGHDDDPDPDPQPSKPDPQDDTFEDITDDTFEDPQDDPVEPINNNILGERYGNTPDDELIDHAYQMIDEGKIYCAVAALEALSLARPHLEPTYKQLAAAADDNFKVISLARQHAAPIGKSTDEASNLSAFLIADLCHLIYNIDEHSRNEHLIIAAAIRCLARDDTKDFYLVPQLRDAVKHYDCLSNNEELNEIINALITFKENSPHKLIGYAGDHSERDRIELDKLLKDAREFKTNNIDNISAPTFHHRYFETRRIILGTGGDLAEHFKIVTDNDYSMIDMLKEYLLTGFFTDEPNAIEERDIDDDKIDSMIDEAWEIAASKVVRAEAVGLLSKLRAGLINSIRRSVEIMCSWLELAQSISAVQNEKDIINYKRARRTVLENVEGAIRNLAGDPAHGEVVLINALNDLRARLDGSYKAGLEKYFYIDFLRGDKVLLLDNWKLDTRHEFFCNGDNSLFGRIMEHSREELPTFEERLRKIFFDDDNFMFARMIDEYIRMRDGRSLIEQNGWNIDECIDFGRRRVNGDKKNFVERLELAQCYGQIDNRGEDRKEKMLQIINAWHSYALRSTNFGVFRQIKEYWENKIKADAKRREKTLLDEIEVHRQRAVDSSRIEKLQPCFDKIKHMIEQQNYTAAEDGLRHLDNEEYWQTPADDDEQDLLSDFMRNYETIYDKVNKLGTTLQNQPKLKNRAMNYDTKGGAALIDNWIANVGNQSNVGSDVLKRLREFLNGLGFNVTDVSQLPVHDRIGSYKVTLESKIGSSKSNYKHPIAAFGSLAEEKGLRIACIAGNFRDKTAPKYLVDDYFKELASAGSMNTIVLLDYPLMLSERHELARISKLNKNDSVVFGVIDRVLIVYLAEHYKKTNISRMLMQLMMPFSYYQPYVFASNLVMPPELFIGRKNELDRIKAPRGANIVYGGRQLGKSALLKMAQMHIDRNENNDRASLIVIQYLDYKAAALKISRVLSIDFFDQPLETDDWDELTRAIRRRLMNEPHIPYFLLMMDEADAFIDSCKEIGYRPFIYLNELQNFGTERFKFVVAGLRDVVRFDPKKALGDNSPLAHLTSMVVKPFETLDAMRLMKEPLKYLGFRFPGANQNEYIIPTILATANYFPGLIQMYCAKLIEAMSNADYAGYSQHNTPVYNIREEHFQKILGDADFVREIKKKFKITLEVDRDGEYNAIALIFAYLYYNKGATGGYTPDEIIEVAEEYELKRLTKLNSDTPEGLSERQHRITALLDQLCEFNILRCTLEGKYLFNRYNFLDLMGKPKEVDSDLLEAAIKMSTEG